MEGVRLDGSTLSRGEVSVRLPRDARATARVRSSNRLTTPWRGIADRYGRICEATRRPSASGLAAGVGGGGQPAGAVGCRDNLRAQQADTEADYASKNAAGVVARPSARRQMASSETFRSPRSTAPTYVR